MPRKNKDGKYILSAGEISTFVLCPESWRLSKVENKRVLITENSKKGTLDHKKWEKDLDLAKKFTWASRVIVLLIVIIIIIYITSKGAFL